MNLTDLSPDAVKILLRDKEYDLEYSFLSLKELEMLYGTEEASGEAVKKFIQNITAVKRDDYIRFLYAGLLHTDIFGEMIDKRRRPWKIDREACMDYISSLLLPKETPLYAVIILKAWVTSTITPEMMEMLEVMSYDDEGKKKAVATQKQNGHSA